MRRDPKRGGRGRRGRPTRENRFDGFDDVEERGDDDRDDAPRGRRKPARKSGRGGRGTSRSRREGFDWSQADGEDGGEEGARFDDDSYGEEAPRRSRRSSRKAPSRKRSTLMDLCTPVFGYVALLPQDATAPHPGYPQFRQEVLASIQRIENEAPEHGIELEDARQAAYALCFFLDGQVAGSEWNAKDQCATEPLGIVLQQDAEGGINFFKRLDELGDRHRAVKEVFLVCLALGFRGKYAELEPAQQAAQIGEIRQKLVRSIHPTPMEKLPELFPEGYTPADSIEDEVPPPPRWWLYASLGTVVVAVVVYVVLFLNAGKIADSKRRAVRELLDERAAAGRIEQIYAGLQVSRGVEGSRG